MSVIHSYSKIFNLGHPEVSMLFNGEVIVQEKVDGSQFSFTLDQAGQLHFRSKGSEVHEGTTDKLFAPAVEAIIAVRDKLIHGYVYRGEVVSKPKHNTLEYKRTPANFVILYDIDATGEQQYFPWETSAALAADAGFEFVPTLHVGIINNADELKALLTTESILGGPIEGVVIKNYREYGRDKKVLMGKHVREEFKEQHKVAWRDANPGRNDIIELIGESFRTPARFQKAVQHLRDAGKLTGTPKDIGPLMKELSQDLHDEQFDVVAKQLAKHFWASIQRKANAGFAEWYKEQLLQSQFSHEQKVAEATGAVIAEHGETLAKLAK